MKQEIYVIALATMVLGTACSQSTTTETTSVETTVQEERQTETSEVVDAEGLYEEDLQGENEENAARDAGGERGGNGGGRGAVTGNSAEIQAIIDANADKFEQFTFTDVETGITLEYSLFIPENYDASISYPLVTYIPDATSVGKTAKAIIEEYFGASSFVTEETQEKNPSFVMVPAFSEVVVNDNFETSEEIDVAVKLIDSLTEEYSIDTNRLYTTGQSMGGMTSFYLNSIYPDKFAASLYVSSQWDINVLKNMESQNFFYIVAGGDAKASAGQTEVMEMFDIDQVAYSYGEWSAKESEEVQNQNAEALISEGNQANFIRFETGTVLPEEGGMEHMASFNYGYSIEVVRDWIYQQSK